MLLHPGDFVGMPQAVYQNFWRWLRTFSFFDHRGEPLGDNVSAELKTQVSTHGIAYLSFLVEASGRAFLVNDITIVEWRVTLLNKQIGSSAFACGDRPHNRNH